MEYLWFLLIPYCAAAYALHGGQIASGLNRQMRNLICAAPFGLVGVLAFGWPIGIVLLILAFVGTNIGHNNFWEMGTESNDPVNNWLANVVAALGIERNSMLWCITGMTIKGLITFPLGGFITLPLSYYIGDRTKFNTSMSEWLTGISYGMILSAIAVILI